MALADSEASIKEVQRVMVSLRNYDESQVLGTINHTPPTPHDNNLGVGPGRLCQHNLKHNR